MVPTEHPTTNPKTNIEKHRPKKTRGDQAVEEGVDRKPAIVGERDLSKLTTTCDTVRDDPNNPGQVMEGDRVTHPYERKVDFDNAMQVKKLNIWRDQVFRRCQFKRLPKSRYPWLQSEKDIALSLIQAHLDHRRMILWRNLRNTYNSHFALSGLIQ
jgi:hypothetical protein